MVVLPLYRLVNIRRYIQYGPDFEKNQDFLEFLSSKSLVTPSGFDSNQCSLENGWLEQWAPGPGT